jgi:hypothetical protein
MKEPLSRPRKAVRVAAWAALGVLALAFAPGCENKMEAKECDKLRGEAFELVNKAQHCNADADCRQSEWPGCQKPISNATFEKIKPMSDSYKKGLCDEPKVECKAPPDSYCKQGLCVHREKGTAEGSGNTPADQIQIK